MNAQRHFIKKKNREIITNICTLIKIISYKEKKHSNIKSQIKIMLCGLLCCRAMVCYGERESNDVLRANCYVMVKYSNAMIRLID